MVTREDVERYLLNSELTHEEVQDGMWVAHAEGGPSLVIHHSPPVLVFRLKVMDVPNDQTRCADLYKRLLRFNATDLVHAAYGLEEEDVVLTETLELENLDQNEFQAVIDSFQMAMATHLEQLAPFRDC
ncbi:MAG TPA: CesT family type III secretion system chaperone [Longimicrobium sp.]|nr:CesT family type III secretion system chaperone [Longimicrobium sp.]